MQPISTQDLNEKLARLQETAGRHFAKFESDLNTSPKTRPCHRHGCDEVLAYELSMERREICYVCPECDERAKQNRISNKAMESGIPADVLHATIENFKTDRPGIVTGQGYVTPTKFMEAAKSFQSGDVRNVVFSGAPGIGKGHLAAGIAMDRIRSGKRVSWIECARLFQEYHRAYNDNTTADVIFTHARSNLLVLDEVCLRDLPADGEEILFNILDARQKLGLQTVFLSNKPVTETRKWFGARISDRLRSGGIIVCYGEWASMRGSEHDGADF